MADGSGTAAEQLARLLYLLPAAADHALPLDEAAARLGVSVQTVLDDVAAVTAREYYHPAGGAEDVRVEVDADRIHVVTHDKFRRPARLSAREALATHLALRRYAAGFEGQARAGVLGVAEHIGAALSTAEPGEFTERFAVEESGGRGEVRSALRRAAHDRRRCRMVYLSARSEAPSERSIDPYAVIVSRGTWFVVGHCGLRDEPRVFRVDRIVDLTPTDETFDVPAGFDASDYVEGGRVFRSDTTQEVTVRYSGTAADWMREQGPVEESTDGEVSVTYEVADPEWVIRHVLQQGGEAEVVAPDDVRRQVARAAGRFSRKNPPVA